MNTAEKLPNELWIKIIREATYLPEALDTTLHDALPPGASPPNLHSGEIVAMICDSLLTKLAISLVCKTWNNACLEFFYEIIVVRDVRYLPPLVESLSHSHLGASKWVQRLDFMYTIPTWDLPVTVCGKAYSTKQLICYADRLIRLCNRLRIFSCRNTGGRMEKFAWAPELQALPWALSGLGGTLESMHWHPSLISKSSGSYQRCPNMRSMSLPDAKPTWYLSSSLESQGLPSDAEDVTGDSDGDGLYERYAAKNDPLLTFHRLHTAFFHTEDRSRELLGMPPDGLHSLRHVYVGQGIMHHHHLKAFLSRNPQVDTLIFSPWAIPYLSDFALNTVRTLILPVKPFPAGLNSTSVERIGLKGTEGSRPDFFQVDHIFRELLREGESGGQFPRLQMIRFVDALTAKTLEGRKFQFKLLYRRCKSCGVRLEDEKGRVMEPRL